MAAVAAWLTAEEGSKKHVELAHPVLTLILGLSLIVGASTVLHDTMAESPRKKPSSPYEEALASGLAYFLLGYLVLLVIIRFPELGAPRLCYEMLWCCNVALLLASLGLSTNRPRLVAAAAISVSIDQLMWYVDLFGFFAFKTWPIGVAKYLAKASLSRIATSTHHIWFIPVCIVAVGFPAATLQRPHAQAFICDFGLSVGIILMVAVTSRWLTPLRLRSQKGNAEPQQRTTRLSGAADASAGAHLIRGDYLNINLVYESWPDLASVSAPTGRQRPLRYLSILLFVWGGLNLPCALLLGYFSSKLHLP